MLLIKALLVFGFHELQDFEKGQVELTDGRRCDWPTTAVTQSCFSILIKSFKTTDPLQSESLNFSTCRLHKNCCWIQYIKKQKTEVLTNSIMQEGSSQRLWECCITERTHFHIRIHNARHIPEMLLLRQNAARYAPT
jgi:hypothetical protein